MFDKLIESEPEGAEFKNRRTYFLVSSLVVGIFFMTAVVISIFAADFGLGNGGFELVEMVAPPDMAATAPEIQQPRRTASAAPSQSQVAIRQVNMSRTDEPTVVPLSISTAQNTQISRPAYGDFTTGKVNFQAGDPNDSGTGRDANGSPTGSGLSQSAPVNDNVKDREPEPPPVRKPVETKPPAIVSGGVVNGKASYLPKPLYPATAVAVHADGKVDVQVMIDESGRVISATAVSGHPLLRNAAVQAARSAKFSPTFLSNVAVKVTGVIVYNFTR